ncbi:MAG: ROK family protein [Candidatus Saccharimonadales bacterium]
MYLAVDVGGSKTLLALFTQDGKIVNKLRIITNPNYQGFIKEIAESIEILKDAKSLSAAAIAIPGLVDRSRGIGKSFGNLPWHNAPVKKDIGMLVGHVPVLVENDSNLAGLSEALLVHYKYKKVVYLTVGTGIGGGIIINGKIDADFLDSEPGQMILNYKGKLKKWEDFASGRAFKTRYGKRASEVTDQAIWQEFSQALALGLNELIATLTPDVVIIGGGVGTYFNKFGHFLIQELKKFESDMIKIPPITKAKRPEEAVLYGCYDFIRQNLA